MKATVKKNDKHIITVDSWGYAGDRAAFERDAAAHLGATGLTLEGPQKCVTINLDGGRVLQYYFAEVRSLMDLSGASCKWGHMPNHRNGFCEICGDFDG